MKNLFKKIFIPSEQKKQISAYKTWIVRWKSISYDNSSLHRSKYEAEIFASKEEAIAFKLALVNAHILLKNQFYSIRIEENNKDR